MRRMRDLLAVIVLFALGAGGEAVAAADQPLDLGALQGVSAAESDGAAAATMAVKLREDAMRQAALSFGARGGLAHRSWEISEVLKTRRAMLSQVFNFRSLLLMAPSGLLIEPPVIVEGKDGFTVSDGGQMAAVADRTYRKISESRIVATPRDWSGYLERGWSAVTPPPALLFPKTPEEKKDWDRWIAEGWRDGADQADEVFQVDLDRLVRDFVGMVRFRSLYAQGMAVMPFANEDDRGITGSGKELRIGDRGVRITGRAALQPRSDLWQPADH